MPRSYDKFAAIGTPFNATDP